MSRPSSIDMSERLRTDYAWTPRQRDVLRLIAAGKTNGEIGVALGISLDGAKWHVSEILSKLGAHSREEAADYWHNYNRPLRRVQRTLRGLALGTGAFKWAAGGVVAASAIAAGIAVVMALPSSGGGDAKPGAPEVIPSATPTRPVPSKLISLAEARRQYLGSGPIADLDAALTSANADGVLSLWKTVSMPCFVGSEKTGNLCAGQPGPAGTEHDVNAVHFESYDSAFTTTYASELLHKILDTNPARLVLLARPSGSDNLLLGYEFSSRTGIFTNPPSAVQYIYLEADPSSAQPIVVLRVSDAVFTPVSRLRSGGFGGSLGDLVAADQQMIDDELRRNP